MKTVLKLLVFNGLVSILNVVVFSSTFLGVTIIGGGALIGAFGVTVTVMSVVSFFYGNYKILTNGQNLRISSGKSFDALEDCKVGVAKYIKSNVKTYAKYLRIVLSQINRFQKKKEYIKDVLTKRFSSNELSYAKFLSTVESVEHVMALNTSSLLNRINAFDEEEYEKILKIAPNTRPVHSYKNDKLMETRINIYNECMDFVEKSVKNNEEILLKIDKLLIEMSKLNDLNMKEIEHMYAMKEIDELIKNTKWYTE